MEVEDPTAETTKDDKLQDDQQSKPHLLKEKLDIVANQIFTKQQTFKTKGSCKCKMILQEPTEDRIQELHQESEQVITNAIASHILVDKKIDKILTNREAIVQVNLTPLKKLKVCIQSQVGDHFTSPNNSPTLSSKPIEEKQSVISDNLQIQTSTNL